jgi:hypothetical protein
MNQSVKDNIERNEQELRLRQSEVDRRAQLVATSLSSLTLADVDRMESTEYGRYLRSNPAFVTRVNELEATRPPRRQFA